jgi:hypothetical protein
MFCLIVGFWQHFSFATTSLTVNRCLSRSYQKKLSLINEYKYPINDIILLLLFRSFGTSFRKKFKKIIKMKTFITLILFGIIYEVIGCRCPVRGVNVDFCKSHFAIKMKVTSEKQLLPGIECYYEIEVLQIYKENNDTQKALSSKRIHTAQDTGGCGRIFELNKTYVYKSFCNEFQLI